MTAYIIAHPYITAVLVLVTIFIVDHQYTNTLKIIHQIRRK